jgi:hypothetical protein
VAFSKEEKVHKVLRRKEFRGQIFELRVVSWVDHEGRETRRHIQKCEKRKELLGEQVIKTKPLDGDDWIVLLENKDDISDLMLPGFRKMEKKDYQEHD